MDATLQPALRASALAPSSVSQDLQDKLKVHRRKGFASTSQAR